MATIYSLIVWAGKNGFGPATTRACTVSGYTFTLANHGLRSYDANKPNSSTVQFVGGTLPGNASSGVTYYVKYLSSTTFELYTNSDLVTGKLTTSSAGSGWVLKSAYYLGLSDKSRWTYGGTPTEYIYSSLVDWNTARSGASAFNTEICEIGNSFVEYYGNNFAPNVPAARAKITTYVNGARSDAFHNRVLNSGYVFEFTTGGRVVSPAVVFFELNGFTVKTPTDGSAIALQKVGVVAINMIALGGMGTTGIGLQIWASGAKAHNCIVAGFNEGIVIQNYIYTSGAFNCTSVKNVYGFRVQYGGTTASGYFYNNISCGNTTNWPTGVSGFDGATKNAGETGNTPWGTSGVTLDKTTAFVNWGGATWAATDDYRPASATSPQVDAGVTVYDAVAYDLADAERPNYNNGGAEEYDIGALEYDHGYGPHPLVRTIDFSGLVAGSQVVIYTTNTTTELARNDSTGTTYSYDAAASGVTVDYTVFKAGYMPIRVLGVSLSATSTPITIQQQLDRAYITPSGLTFGSNVIVNVSSRVVTSLQVTTSTTVQNWYSYLMDSWIASSTNTTLKNVAFPVIPFGEASFTTINGIEFSDGATSISYFKRDGFRYSSDAGVTATAIWAAILTLDTPAGTQIKYRQSPSGSIVSAATTGPMDQLVQVYGNASHGNFDYRTHMVLRAPNPGYSQPMPNLVATYGSMTDGLFVAAMAPALQYATTNADIDAAHLALDNTAKTYTITAAHTMLELYQRAQWWANQDAQWDADIPLTTTDGSTFTQPSNWSMIGVSYLTGGTLAGGKATLAAGTQGIAYAGVEMTLGAAGTYTFTMAGSSKVIVTPTGPSTYIFGAGSFNGTLTVNNATAHAVTIEIPNGVTTSTAGNTGGAITFSAPAIYQSVTVNNITTTSRVQIYDTTSATELYNGVPGTTSYTWTDPTPAESTRAIRLRIANVVGATAKEFIEANIGTCATSGAGKDISYLAAQANDAVYNLNAIDGSTVTGVTFTDSAIDKMNIDLSGGTTDLRSLYAAWCHYAFTEAGIRTDIDYIRAIDSANYVYSNLIWKNTTSPTVPLKLTGGYAWDSVTEDPMTLVDTTGGTIFLAPPHVVTKIVSVAGSSVITGDVATVLAAIPSASTNASAATAAIFAQAQVTPIEATSQGRLIESGLTEAEAKRIMLAALAGKVVKSGTNIKFKSVDGLTDRIDGTVDDLGNRTAVALNGG